LFPVCDTSSGTCVATACAANSDCAALAPVCKNRGTTNAICGPCSTDRDCTYWADHVCGTSGACILPVCSEEDACPAATPHCENPGRADAFCTGCVDNNDCYLNPGWTCSSSGACVSPPCDNACTASTPRCDVSDTGVATCGGCVRHGDCAAFRDATVCVSEANLDNSTTASVGSCRGGCLNSVDCNDPATPWCDTGRNVCVECLVSADCYRASQMKPLCDAGQCGMCTSDKQCLEDYPLWPACHTEFENNAQTIGVCVEDSYNKGFSVAAIVLGSIGVFGVAAAIIIAVVLGASK